jgi:F0F1-type ATP synthase membrane subunit b/b'
VKDAALYLEIAVWSQIVSSIVFIGVLVYMWKRWVMPVVLGAQQRSNEQIAQAERHRDEVKAALVALRGEIESAQHDAQLIEQRADARARHEREALLQETAEAGERALQDAGREIDRARAAARLRLREELLERALQLARNEAPKRVGPAIDARLVEQLGESLQSLARG